MAGGIFQPDSAEFVDVAMATAQLKPIADAWLAYPGAYREVSCVGRTLPIGPEETALVLSQRRAEAAGSILTALGVASINAVGKGSSDPLPDLDPLDPAQRSVSCQLIPNT